MHSSDTIGKAQEYIRQTTNHGIDGWLVYDYRRSNPFFWDIVGDGVGTITRPCFLFIPASGEPRLLAHHVDAGKFALTGLRTAVYRSRETMLEGLGGLLPAGGHIAMEYSPLGLLPRASKVDAGTIELVRGLGVDVVSSADLLQYATQRWSQAQLSSHLRAADALGRIVLEAFDHIGQNLSSSPTEYQVAELIRRRLGEEGLHSPMGP